MRTVLEANERVKVGKSLLRKGSNEEAERERGGEETEVCM